MADHVRVSCEQCGQQVSKYRCPGCLKKTCSLSCVNNHKKEAGCNGKRKITSYVAMESMNDAHLINDLKFLEQATRKVQVLSDGKSDINPMLAVSGTASHGTLRCNRNVLSKLQKAASLRHIDLRLAPFLTTRRKANSTYCNCKTSRQVSDRTKMFWHIRWIFQDQSCEQRCVPEDEVLSEMVNNIISDTDNHVEPGSQRDNSKTDSNKWVLLRSAVLKYQRSVGSDSQLLVIMDAEHVKTPANSAYQLNRTLSLAENLRGKVIVEHPVLRLVAEDDLSNYTLL